MIGEYDTSIVMHNDGVVQGAAPSPPHAGRETLARTDDWHGHRQCPLHHGLEKATDRISPVVLTSRHNVRMTRIPRYGAGGPIVGENGGAAPNGPSWIAADSPTELIPHSDQVGRPRWQIHGNTFGR